MRQPIPNVRSTSQKRKPDPEVIIKYDYLYARTWECEFESPIFNSERDEPRIRNFSDFAVHSELLTDQCVRFQKSYEKILQKLYPTPTDFCGGTVTDHYMESDAGMGVEQPNLTYINPRSSKFDLGHNPKLTCNDDYRYKTFRLS